MYTYKESVKMPEVIEKQLLALQNEALEAQAKLMSIYQKLQRINGMLHSILANETDALAKFDNVDEIIKSDD